MHVWFARWWEAWWCMVSYVGFLVIMMSNKKRSKIAVSTRRWDSAAWLITLCYTVTCWEKSVPVTAQLPLSAHILLHDWLLPVCRVLKQGRTSSPGRNATLGVMLKDLCHHRWVDRFYPTNHNTLNSFIQRLSNLPCLLQFEFLNDPWLCL